VTWDRLADPMDSPNFKQKCNRLPQKVVPTENTHKNLKPYKSNTNIIKDKNVTYPVFTIRVKLR